MLVVQLNGKFAGKSCEMLLSLGLHTVLACKTWLLTFRSTDEGVIPSAGDRGTASPAASASVPVQTLSPDQFSLHSAYSGGATVSSQIQSTLTCFIQLFPAIKHHLNRIRPKPAADRHDTEKRVFLGDVFLSQFKAFCIRLYRGTDLF